MTEKNQAETKSKTRREKSWAEQKFKSINKKQKINAKLDARDGVSDMRDSVWEAKTIDNLLFDF